MSPEGDDRTVRGQVDVPTVLDASNHTLSGPFHPEAPRSAPISRECFRLPQVLASVLCPNRGPGRSSSHLSRAPDLGDGSVRWNRREGEYLIERKGQIVTYGVNP